MVVSFDIRNIQEDLLTVQGDLLMCHPYPCVVIKWNSPNVKRQNTSEEGRTHLGSYSLAGYSQGTITLSSKGYHNTEQ